MLTYKQSGVDIDEGNRAVNLIKGKIKYKVIESRQDAIHYALDNIKSKEVVFISGRGNRELMCENNAIKKHLDKNVVVNYANGGK